MFHVISQVCCPLRNRAGIGYGRVCVQRQSVLYRLYRLSSQMLLGGVQISEVGIDPKVHSTKTHSPRISHTTFLSLTSSLHGDELGRGVRCERGKLVGAGAHGNLHARGICRMGDQDRKTQSQWGSTSNRVTANMAKTARGPCTRVCPRASAGRKPRRRAHPGQFASFHRSTRPSIGWGGEGGGGRQYKGGKRSDEKALKQ